jgi:outer membrane protein
VDAAKQGSAISNIAFTAAHQQVIYNVSLAFYANAAARARLGSAGEALRDAEEVETAAQSRYKQGIGTVVEVAQTRQATAEAELERVQAEGAAQNAYVGLISAIGISPMTKLGISDISRRKLSASMMAPVERMVSAALARAQRCPFMTADCEPPRWSRRATESTRPRQRSRKLETRQFAKSSWLEIHSKQACPRIPLP